MEEVLLELSQGLHFLRADLAWVAAADLDDDAASTFDSAFAQMLLGLPLRLEPLLAARALLMGVGIPFWILMPLLPERLMPRFLLFSDSIVDRPVVIFWLFAVRRLVAVMMRLLLQLLSLLDVGQHLVHHPSLAVALDGALLLARVEVMELGQDGSTLVQLISCAGP